MIQEHPIYWVSYKDKKTPDNSYHYDFQDKRYTMAFVDGHVAAAQTVYYKVFTNDYYTLNNDH